MNLNFKYKVAIATSDEVVVNKHFGHAESFMIVGIDDENKVHKISTRKVKVPCSLGEHDSKILDINAKLLSDCKYVLVSRIGQGALNVLRSYGVTAIELPGFIEESLQRLTTYDEIQNLFQ